MTGRTHPSPARQTASHRLSCRSPDGERLLFRDPVRHHYLPSLRDASPDTRRNAASHLGNGSGVPTRDSAYGERAARSQLLFAFGHLPIGRAHDDPCVRTCVYVQTDVRSPDLCRGLLQLMALPASDWICRSSSRGSRQRRGRLRRTAETALRDL